MNTNLKRAACLLLGFLLLAPLAAGAWSAAGHMATAEIAYRRLSPAARAEADRLIAVLANLDPKVDTFIAASAWMDMLRGEDFSLYNSWHYINLPYNAGALSSVAGPRPDNVVAVIQDARATLASPKAGDFVRAQALRFLLHLMGDIHQPLHAIGRFTAEHPDGDRGGNLFPVATPEKDLHWYWDNAAGWLPTLDANNPAAWRPALPALVAKITTGNPPESFPERTEKDPMAWARESYALAVSSVYQGITPGTTPSDAYSSRAHEICRKRLALAGYRLADLLEEAFAKRAKAQ